VARPSTEASHFPPRVHQKSARGGLHCYSPSALMCASGRRACSNRRVLRNPFGSPVTASRFAPARVSCSSTQPGCTRKSQGPGLGASRACQAGCPGGGPENPRRGSACFGFRVSGELPSFHSITDGRGLTTTYSHNAMPGKGRSGPGAWAVSIAATGMTAERRMPWSYISVPGCATGPTARCAVGPLLLLLLD
jgi:hypothetical protein